MAVGFGSTSWYNPTRAKPFTPWTPPVAPPAGSYDPALSSALGQATRSYQYLGQDIGTANQRATQDYGLDRRDVETARDRGFADLTTNRDRGFFDLDRGQGRNLQDYGIATSALQRAYGQLGRRQAEGQRVAGVMSGGLIAAAAKIRAENQGIEQSALDLQRNRGTEDYTTSRSRVGEDFTRDYGRVGQDATNQLGRIDLNYNRGAVDRNTQLSRAGIDYNAFKLDTANAQGYQATQAGWDPGTRPANQGVNAKGVPYIERTITGVEGRKWIVRYDQNGKELSRRRP